jgi:hypothetical protein
MKQGILLLTDGHANIGVLDGPTLNRQAAALLEDFHGLTLSCVGYGTTHNAELLTAIAAQGGGSYNVVTDLEDVATVFGDILGGLQATIAQELKVHVPLTATQLTLFPGHPALFLGDLQAGGEHVVLLRDVAPSDTLTLRAYETTTGRPIEHTLSVSTVPTASELLFGHIALFRIQVVEFLKEIQAYLTQTASEAVRVALLDRRTRLLAHADTLSVEPNPLLVLLRDELIGCEQYVAAPIRAPHYARQSSTIVTQHMSHLGYARGVRCSAATGAAGAAGAAATSPTSPPPHAPAHAPALMSTFSSPCQRTASHALRTSTTARHDTTHHDPAI